MLRHFKLGIKVYLFILLISMGSILLVFIPFIWTMPFILLLTSLFYVRITK